LLGALYIVPALYYYFRIVVHAWLREPSGEARTQVTPGQSVALAVMCFVTLVAGIYPEPFIRMATYSLTLPSVLFGR
jgi:NADH:ubiquinone oxidoreductase subunit 2 (subunit N)